MTADQFRVDSHRSDPDDTPQSGLEYRARIVSPQSDDEFLARNNLGLGVYSTGQYWQQVDNFRQFMYAQAAMEDYLFWLAERVTRRRVSREGFSWEFVDQNGDIASGSIEPWDDLDDERKADEGRLPEYATDLLQRASEDQEEIIATTDRLVDARYDEMPTPAKLQAIRALTTYDPGKRAPQGRILMAQHEMSRSKDGRLIDSATTDSKEIVRDQRPQGPVNS